MDKRKITVSIFGGEAEDRDLCLKCNTLIFSCLNLIGHLATYCNCGVRK